MNNPKRGEIWLVELDPTRGQEIKKTRPAVVISSEFFSSIAIRIIIPIAKWQPKFQNRPFMVPIPRCFCIILLCKETHSAVLWPSLQQLARYWSRTSKRARRACIMKRRLAY